MRIAAIEVEGKVTAAYRKLASRVEALNLKALSTAGNRPSNVERVGWGQSCNTPVGVFGFVHYSTSTRALQSYCPCKERYENLRTKSADAETHMVCQATLRQTCATAKSDI